MSAIHVSDVSLDFPIKQPPSRFLKAQVAQSLGGLWHSERGKAPFVRALDGVSFSLGPGDRLGIVGRNGAGKTTLLRLLSRIYEPSAGSIRIEGRVVSFLDLTAGFDIEATGYENIVLRGKLNGWEDDALGEAQRYVEDISGLGRFLALPLRTYSAGMLMRLAFGLATAKPADIVLMDEWLAVGDAEYLLTAERRMAELISAAGILVLASHSPAFIEKWCTRLLVLDAGRITFLGNVREGLSQAAT